MLLVGEDANDRVKRRLGLTIAVEEERAASRAPRERVIEAPKCNHLHGFVVLNEGAEKARIGLRQPAVCSLNQAALGGRGVAGDVRSGPALAALRAVDVQFSN